MSPPVPPSRDSTTSSQSWRSQCHSSRRGDTVGPYTHHSDLPHGHVDPTSERGDVGVTSRPGRLRSTTLWGPSVLTTPTTLVLGPVLSETHSKGCHSSGQSSVSRSEGTEKGLLSFLPLVRNDRLRSVAGKTTTPLAPGSVSLSGVFSTLIPCLNVDLPTLLRRPDPTSPPLPRPLDPGPV